MGNHVKEFVRRCDHLLIAAQNQKSLWETEGKTFFVQACANLINGVEILREKALNGSLPPSDGIGWGLAKAVGEWGDDTELADLAFDLEQFYRKNL